MKQSLAGLKHYDKLLEKQPFLSPIWSETSTIYFVHVHNSKQNWK